MSHFSDGCERIRKIKWATAVPEMIQDYRIAGALVNEYLRRLAILDQQVGGIIVSHLGPYPPFQGFTLTGEQKEEIGAVLKPLNITPEELHLCTTYLCWSLMQDAGLPVALQHSDLYEPLLVYFELGGRLDYWHNYLTGLNDGVFTKILSGTNYREELDREPFPLPTGPRPEFYKPSN